MSIKNIGPNKRSRYKQGHFNISESKKYVGEGPVIYRSSWEKLFCEYCEATSKIINWNSEGVKVKYFLPGETKSRTYYIDFYVRTDEGKEFLIEIKPASSLVAPQQPTVQSGTKWKNYVYAAKEYVKNVQKWRAAKNFAESRSMKFVIMTEKELNLILKNGKFI